MCSIYFMFIEIFSWFTRFKKCDYVNNFNILCVFFKSLQNVQDFENLYLNSRIILPKSCFGLYEPGFGFKTRKIIKI